jgi:hypothetical protein
MKPSLSAVVAALAALGVSQGYSPFGTYSAKVTRQPNPELQEKADAKRLRKQQRNKPRK